MPYRFNRLELAGSFGDLGTLLPLAIGMILVNGLDAAGLFFTVGVYYILSGTYTGITVPVQPMKVIGAYAIATGLSASVITAAGLWLGVLMLLIGSTGLVTLISRYTPKPVIRGVQISTGVLLMGQGIKFMIGTSGFQQAAEAVEPYLVLQSVGAIPVGLIIGVIGGFLTLLLLDNKRLPAGLLVVLGGMLIGVLWGTRQGFDRLELGLHLPTILPFGWPTIAEFSTALLVLVLPQIPMTLGNAVIAYADLSREYFGEDSRNVTDRSACISIGLANLFSVLLGGMPLCHGAGGLAAHYRFGARTAGSNLMIGGLFALLAVLFGERLLALLYLLPMAVLGILLVFAGGQLALTIIDLKERKDLFVALLMVGITLASNLAAGFIVGIAVTYLLRFDRLSV